MPIHRTLFIVMTHLRGTQSKSRLPDKSLHRKKCNGCDKRHAEGDLRLDLVIKERMRSNLLFIQFLTTVVAGV